MVGEIRDNETMEMAIHSAMTGHLVLSTLHTNSAAGTLPRLIDMGAEPFLLSSTINVIMAQRLVRRLCPECRKEYFLNADELNSLKANYDMGGILEAIKKSGVVKMKKEEKEGDDEWKKIKFFKAVGCEQCGNEGYHSRLGIYEVLEVDDEIERMISQKATEEEIETKAKEKGMLTMVEDGFIKATEGATSVEELLRVTRE